ncbi:Ejaculatory bulb-specific protein 3 [Orchesella cincta]|uniref:Ejaculatory bulb-specific protein 3 n=1 Tax=Orchesella cincta TaxID=48709 RepID=A0A1D2NF01_ORCCI|nr:Ejaculatory bulb-specific protein 3 [Orchesella cincta]
MMRKCGRQEVCVLIACAVSLAVLSCVSAQLQQQDDGGMMMAYYDVHSPGPQMYQSGPRSPRSILQNFAVDRMLKDKGFVRSIINCVLDKGPCESNGRKLRLMAPEILRGQCPGCSRTVHNQIRKVISHVQRNFPVEWSEVTRRFMSYNNPSAQGFGQPQPNYNPDPNMNMYQNMNMYG